MDAICGIKETQFGHVGLGVMGLWGLGFRGLGFRVYRGLGFRVQELKLRVWGFMGFKAQG